MSATPLSTSPGGEAITFYSYKGGTGRTMALANVACLLADEGAHRRSARVLMIDWDLEAPGLHRFFRNSFGLPGRGAELDRELDEREGLLELLKPLRDEIYQNYRPDRIQDQDAVDEMLATRDLTPYILKTDNPRLHLMKAGRQDESYGEAVGTFEWEGLFKRSPWFFRSLVDRLSREYDYVLIDSRTGETDTSGICTRMLPQKLVVVFTLNRQSLTGVDRLVRQAVAYRRNSEDPRPLAVFPLASRVDSTYPTNVASWRDGSPNLDLMGYRWQFEALLKEVYALETCDLEEYFKEVELQYIPEYSFGEQIAVRDDTAGSRLSFAKSYETFATWLVERKGPWENSRLVQERAAREEERRSKARPEGHLDRQASQVFEQLSGEDQAIARRLFLRLVRVPTPGEDIGETAVALPLAGLEEAETRVAQAFAAQGVLSIDANAKEPAVRIPQPDLIRQWRRLRQWLDAEREFLVWRQQLRTYLADWDRAKRARSALLSGAQLKAADGWAARRGADLSDPERDYISRSARFSRVSSIVRVAAFAIFVGVLGYQSLGSRHQDRTQQALAMLLQADSFAARKQSDSAIARYNQAIELTPENAVAYAKRGEAYDATGDTVRALGDYDRALQLDDTLAAAHLARAGYYLRRGDYSRAIDDFTRVLAKDSANAQAYMGRGETFAFLGRMQAALADLSRAIALRPADVRARLSRGEVFTRLGFKDSAAADYRSVLQSSTDPQDSVLAVARLRQLGQPITLTPDTSVSIVYVQFADENDRALVGRLAGALRGSPYRVAGIERRDVRTSGDVRYFHREDLRLATQLGNYVELALAEQGIRIKLGVIFTSTASSRLVPKGQLELWLPSLRRVPAPMS